MLLQISLREDVVDVRIHLETGVPVRLAVFVPCCTHISSNFGVHGDQLIWAHSCQVTYFDSDLSMRTHTTPDMGPPI